MAEHRPFENRDIPLSERLAAWERLGCPTYMLDDETMQRLIRDVVQLEQLAAETLHITLRADGADLPLLIAVRTYVDHAGKAGAPIRAVALRAAMDELTARDPVMAVVRAAALWLDGDGRHTHVELFTDLQDTVDGLRPTDVIVNEAPPAA
jgi:hypothetical protein